MLYSLGLKKLEGNLVGATYDMQRNPRKLLLMDT